MRYAPCQQKCTGFDSGLTVVGAGRGWWWRSRGRSPGARPTRRCWPGGSDTSPGTSPSAPSGEPLSSTAQRIEYQTREYGWKIENILIFRTLLNSPLLRRKKSLLDSSEEDISEAERPRHPAPGYQNLETFQKQKLRQKVETLCGLLMSLLNCDILDIGGEDRTTFISNLFIHVSVII